MMKQSKSVFSLVLLFSLLSGTWVQGQTIEKSKQLSRSFPVGSDTEIEISNKYGNIHLMLWDKDSVRFDIQLQVKGAKQSRVDKAFNLVDFEFHNSEYYVIAKTVFGGNSFWNDVSDLTGTVFSSSTKTTINYTVYLPAGASLKVVNKYGNIYTTDHHGKIVIELSNGDLKAHRLLGNTTVKTEFGNADIKEIKGGRLNISYGELYLEQSTDLEIQSKSSELHLGTVGNLEVDSKRDKYFLTGVKTLRGSAYFSRFTIEEIDELFDLSTKYGDVEIRAFSDKVDFFNLKSVDTDITLHFTDDKQYKLEMLVDEQTDVYYSKSISNIESTDLKDGEKRIKVDCVVGNNASFIIPLTIDSRAGSLSLKRK